MPPAGLLESLGQPIPTKNPTKNPATKPNHNTEQQHPTTKHNNTPHTTKQPSPNVGLLEPLRQPRGLSGLAGRDDRLRGAWRRER